MDHQDAMGLLEAAGFTAVDTAAGPALLAGGLEHGEEWSVELTDTATGGPPTAETAVFKAKVFGSDTACDLVFESADPRDMVALVVGAANAVSFGIHAESVADDRGFRYQSGNAAAGATVFIHNPFAEQERGDWTGTQEEGRDFVLDDPSVHYGRDYSLWRDTFCQALVEPQVRPSI